MKSKKTKVVSFTLELNEDEASWLKGMVQNPLSENEDPTMEEARDCDMRNKFWEALQ